MRDHERMATDREDIARLIGEPRPGASGEARIVEGALARIRACRRRRRTVGVAAAAMAAAGCWVLWWTGVLHTILPVGGSIHEPNDVWVTDTRPATFRLGPHRVDLSTASLVRVDRGDPSSAGLALIKGQATLSVRGLKAGGSFMIRTRHIQVKVLGTRFSVSLKEGCSRVDVSEGTVHVRSVISNDEHNLNKNQVLYSCKDGKLLVK